MKVFNFAKNLKKKNKKRQLNLLLNKNQKMKITMNQMFILKHSKAKLKKLRVTRNKFQLKVKKKAKILLKSSLFPKKKLKKKLQIQVRCKSCLLYTSPSPRDLSTSRMPSSA